MVNLCRSHITALKKVRTALSSPITSMDGLGINAVLTKDDYKKIAEARINIDAAINILNGCNQL